MSHEFRFINSLCWRDCYYPFDVSFFIKKMDYRTLGREIRSEQGEWLIEILEPAIEEIEIRGKETLEGFMSKFFGSVGKMTAEAKKLDPMNDIRKAAKTGDWMSLAVEYMANKSGIGHLFTPR